MPYKIGYNTWEHYEAVVESFYQARRIVATHRPWFAREAAQAELHPAVRDALEDAPPTNWQQLLLEWAHRSDTDYTKIAYTRDERSGEADRQTTTSIGKYLTRHFPLLPEHRIRDLAALHGANSAFEIIRDMRRMIDALENSPGSCMVGKFAQYRESDDSDSGDSSLLLVSYQDHPYQCYAPQYGWALAVRREGDRIMGRALVYEGDATDEKCFVRSYRRPANGDYGGSDEGLETWLRGQGYTRKYGWPEGAQLAYIEHAHRRSGSPFIAPYLDGEQTDVNIGGYGSTRYLSICNAGEGDWECRRTDGVAEDSSGRDCDNCGRRTHEDDGYWAGYHSDTFICESCRFDCFTLVIGRRGNEYLINSDDAVYVEDDGNYYDQDYLGANGVVELHDGTLALEDNCVDVDGQWYRNDDDSIVELANGDYALYDDCVEIDGRWYKTDDDDVWLCAESGDYYHRSSDEPVEIDGRLYHEDSEAAQAALNEEE